MLMIATKGSPIVKNEVRTAISLSQLFALPPSSPYPFDFEAGLAPSFVRSILCPLCSTQADLSLLYDVSVLRHNPHRGGLKNETPSFETKHGRVVHMPN